MQYSFSALKRKANLANYSFQKGYQRYNHKGWGYVHMMNGERIVGYQIFDDDTDCLVYPSYNDLHNYAMKFADATALLRKLCANRGVFF